MHDNRQFPCPCCGYLVFDRAPGNHETCPICGWEDDLTQLRFVQMPGSANPTSLVDAQHNFREFGASSHRVEAEVRDAFDDEPRDPDWRPVNPDTDNIEQPSRGASYAESYPTDDTTVLYYWGERYWRRLSG